MDQPANLLRHNGMHMHFSRKELSDRQRRAVNEIIRRGLHGLLMFRQESMYYLTGYDTFGYVFFQCLYLGADGRMVLLTRAPDYLQARFTSVIPDVRTWMDRPEAAPAGELRKILMNYGAERARLGVEWDAYGLTGRNAMHLKEAFEGFSVLEDASDLVSRLRVVKSSSELAYVRKAGELADAALKEAVVVTHGGVFEGDILAAMQGAIYRGGGDDPANEFIIGSGVGALMCRYYSGRRYLDPEDQLTLEFAGVYRHYHACLMRTIVIGHPDPRLVSMHKAAVEALQQSEEALRPGRPIGEVFDAHARVLDAHGHQSHRMNACGYSVGTTYAPNWMDWPMLYHGNPVEAMPGMVFFIHIIIFDAEHGLAMTLGRTSIVTERSSYPISEPALDLVVR